MKISRSILNSRSVPLRTAAAGLHRETLGVAERHRLEPFLISRTSSTSRPWTMLVAPITSVLFGRFERRERLTEEAIRFARHLRQCHVLTDDAERGQRGHRGNDAR